jgi:hypothetical protein
LVIVVALSVTFLTGCSEQQSTTGGPSASQKTVTLDKTNPQVQAVMAVQNRHTEELLAKQDIVGTGVGVNADGVPVLLVLAKHEGVENVPAMIEGIPTRVDVVGEVRAMGNTGTYRPVPCGVSTGNNAECAAGTIGCVVIKSGTQYALSNNHVFARENAASNGERIDQPGRYDAHPKCGAAGQIATLAGFKPIVFSTSANNDIDCAIAQYTTSDLCSMVNNTYTPSSTIAAAAVGMAVKKTGRTSGETHGTISGINVTLNVGYSAGTARFINQIYVASSFIRSGDSGSLMVTDNANANPVGLCFAGGSGTSFANPIGPVLSFFNATVCGQ